MRCVICGRALTAVAHQVSGGVVGPNCAQKLGLKKRKGKRVVLFARLRRQRVEQAGLFAEVVA